MMMLTAVILGVVTPCGFTDGYKRFGETYFHLQGLIKISFL
jgi:hypothetical protein